MGATDEELDKPGYYGRAFYFIINIGCLTFNRAGLNEKLCQFSCGAVHLKSV